MSHKKHNALSPAFVINTPKTSNALTIELREPLSDVDQETSDLLSGQDRGEPTELDPNDIADQVQAREVAASLEKKNPNLCPEHGRPYLICNCDLSPQMRDLNQMLGKMIAHERKYGPGSVAQLSELPDEEPLPYQPLFEEDLPRAEELAGLQADNTSLRKEFLETEARYFEECTAWAKVLTEAKKMVLGLMANRPEAEQVQALEAVRLLDAVLMQLPKVGGVQ